MATHGSYMLSILTPRRIPITFVTGYPKSGTVWVTQLVADYLQYPVIDLSFFPAGCPCVMHGHYLVRPNSPPMVYVVRDGRDAMVSMYFFMSREIPNGDYPKLPSGYARHFKGLKNKQDILTFLPTFIRRQFARPFGCRFSWDAHVAAYFEAGRPDIPLVRYEEMLKDPFATLAAALRTLTDGQAIDEEQLRCTINKYSFEKQTGRRPGSEDQKSFVRKGRAGDWKNYFSAEAARTFDEIAGQTLIDLGYERDRNWTRQL